MLFATPKYAIQGFAAAHRLGWKPRVYVASISIEPNIMAIARLNAPTLTKGALSVAFVKNLNDPIWRKDAALALYRKVMSRYHPRQAGRRLQLVRDDRRLDDGRDAEARGEDADLGEHAPSRTEPNLTGNPFLLPGSR